MKQIDMTFNFIRYVKIKGLFNAIKRIIEYIYLGIIGPYNIPTAIIQYKSQIKNINGLENLYQFADRFEYKKINFKPSQIKEEFIKFLSISSRIKPKIILEIGTADGGTLFLFTRILDPNGIIISVDLSSGNFSRYPDFKLPLFKSFAIDDQKIILIRGNSHDSNTLNKIKKIINDSSAIDILFIDGDHSYEGVFEDYKKYSKLVNEKGIIAFHDIVPGDPDCVGGVPQFWQELKVNKQVIEIVEDWHHNGCGIGVIMNYDNQRSSQ